jgi:hypothetical protein
MQVCMGVHTHIHKYIHTYMHAYIYTANAVIMCPLRGPNNASLHGCILAVKTKDSSFPDSNLTLLDTLAMQAGMYVCMYVYVYVCVYVY